MKYVGICFLILLLQQRVYAQNKNAEAYNVTWNSPSKNSSESMPCGGGDIGLNVWVEKGDLLFYIARSGTYDENNALLKLGRVRIRILPNPFEGGRFSQTLNLKDGCVDIVGERAKQVTTIKLWVDVFSPNIRVEISSTQPVKVNAGYENWRYQNTFKSGLENNENGFKYGAKAPIASFKDSVRFQKNGVLFYHQNQNQYNIFDRVVKQQGLDSVKDELFNPQQDLIFGGTLFGSYMQPDATYGGKYLNTSYKGWMMSSAGKHKTYQLNISLHSQQTKQVAKWEGGLSVAVQQSREGSAQKQKTLAWWHNLWSKSFIYINPDQRDTSQVAWQSGRNYQLFRYMLACNAFGSYPTKFNGGLFTYDPELVNKDYRYTPDFRNWGGSVFTAQNQRLVYYPMLKNGDFELMKPQFEFYLRILKTAQIATRAYWHHNGARFPEQIENFGLSNYAEYGIDHPKTLDAGVDDNPWLEYHWETVLEFCYMMLQTEIYAGQDISKYVPFIESCLDFFDEHYQYLAHMRGSKMLDGNGQLILYPGSAGETFKMTLNSTSTIAGLTTVLKDLLASGSAGLDNIQRGKFAAMLRRVPPLNYRIIDGHQTISPAKSWERINNEESPQLYPIYPYGIFALGKPNFDTAINTWKYDPNVVKFKSYVGWKQDNIVAARLGLDKEAAELTFAKLKNSGRRFPAFWGPGFDWAPDHNWGGSGMVGLQEMLLQTVGDKIYLFPAWPADIDVHFKLYAEKQTTVECELKKGKIAFLKVVPASRAKDVVNYIDLPH